MIVIALELHHARRVLYSVLHYTALNRMEIAATSGEIIRTTSCCNAWYDIDIAPRRSLQYAVLRTYMADIEREGTRERERETQLMKR